MEPTKILIVDDHALVRDGLRSFLGGRPGLKVVGEASGIPELLAFQGEVPDVILLDVTLNKENSLKSLPEIKNKFAKSKIVVLSMHDELNYMREAFLNGAVGYVLKNADNHALLAALDGASRGEF